MKKEEKEIQTVVSGITDIVSVSFEGITSFNEILSCIDEDELQPGTIRNIYQSFRTIIETAQKEIEGLLDFAAKNIGELRFERASYNQPGVDPMAIIRVELDTRFVEKKKSGS